MDPADATNVLEVIYEIQPPAAPAPEPAQEEEPGPDPRLRAAKLDTGQKVPTSKPLISSGTFKSRVGGQDFDVVEEERVAAADEYACHRPTAYVYQKTEAADFTVISMVEIPIYRGGHTTPAYDLAIELFCNHLRWR